MSAIPRQIWIDGVERSCLHKPAEIRSEGGVLLAERCAYCLYIVAEYGKCAGCLKEGRLTHFRRSGRVPMRFCEVECEHNLKARKLAEKKAAVK